MNIYDYLLGFTGPANAMLEPMNRAVGKVAEDTAQAYEDWGKSNRQWLKEKAPLVSKALDATAGIPDTPGVDFLAMSPSMGLTFSNSLKKLWGKMLDPRLYEGQRWPRYWAPTTNEFIKPESDLRNIVSQMHKHPMVGESRLSIVPDEFINHPDSQTLKHLAGYPGTGTFGYINPNYAIDFPSKLDFSKLKTPRDVKAAILSGAEADPTIFISKHSQDPVRGLMEGLGEASMGKKWHSLKRSMAEPSAQNWFPPEIVYEDVPNYFSLPFKYYHEPKELKSIRARFRQPWKNWIDLGQEQATSLVQKGKAIPDEEMFQRIMETLDYQRKYMKKHMPEYWRGR